MNACELLHYGVEFTRRYRAATDKYSREASCLDWQFRHSLLPMEQTDRVAGRIQRLPMGILPQEFWGMGYYINEDAFLPLTEEASLTPAQRQQAKELLCFWKSENTCSKIVAAYPTEWTDALACRVPYNTPTNGFLLHRISGIQMDPSRLLRLGVGGMTELCRSKSAANPIIRLESGPAKAVSAISHLGRLK